RSNLASLDAGAAAELLALNLDLQTDGTAQVQFRDGLEWDINLGSNGRFFGVPAEISLDASADGLLAEGTLASEAFTLSSSLEREFTASGAWSRFDFDLNGEAQEDLYRVLG